ncbi:Aste57867_24476 [Aphanomyces stellatus]|uniref:Aste57867_24476 protein n=1 Tax=Aphanomyces stellatus TaxID=120398 RepID=A0A485LQR3_9STRA|nr:hypothetical protein As57867_024399 [Aphanomyces stellatus]VFU01115.1 Aste57867_24476 [Aphanomyces stellatus]
MPSAKTLATPADVAAADFRVRRQNQERSREARRVNREHLMYLREKVADLTRQLQTRTKMLPWKDIADALGTAVVEAKTSSHAMRRKIQETERLLLILAPWSQDTWMPEAIREKNKLLRAAGWRDHALLGHGDGRLMSYQWLTERLYQNTDLAMAQCHNTPSMSVVVSCDDNVVTSVVRSHYLIHGRKDRVTDAIDRTRKLADVNTSDAYFDQELLRHAFGNDLFHVNFGDGQTSIYRHFCTPTRSVVVSVAVTYDADRPELYRRERCIQGWRVVDQVDENVCRVLRFASLSLPTTISVDECAQIMGLPVTDIAHLDDSARLEALMRQRREMYEASERTSAEAFFKALTAVD